MSDKILATVRRRVSVGGRVTDGPAGQPIPGTTVRIAAEDRTFAAEMAARQDGLYYFLNLADGKYLISATHPASPVRYAPVQERITVSKAPKKKSDPFISLDLVLRPTTIRGKVTDDKGSGIGMVNVELRGSPDRTVSAADGQFLLAAVEPVVSSASKGLRRLTVSAHGFRPASADVLLNEPGMTAVIDFALKPIKG